MKWQFQELVELLERCEFRPQEYVARGAYGRRCLAVQRDNQGNTALEVVTWYLNDALQGGPRMLAQSGGNIIKHAASLCEMLADTHVDNLGRGYIVYWPSIPWEEAEPEETDPNTIQVRLSELNEDLVGAAVYETSPPSVEVTEKIDVRERRTTLPSTVLLDPTPNGKKDTR